MRTTDQMLADKKFLEEVNGENPSQEKLDELIEQGADVNTRPLNVKTKWNAPTEWNTPLIIAIQKKNRALITYLLNKNADITNIRNLPANNAFMEAVITNDLDIVQELVETLMLRAPADDLDNELAENWTSAPLELCKLSVDYIRSIPGINTANIIGQTPLMIAEAGNNPDMVEYLIALGATHNIPQQKRMLEYEDSSISPHTSSSKKPRYFAPED